MTREEIVTKKNMNLNTHSQTSIQKTHTHTETTLVNRGRYNNTKINQVLLLLTVERREMESCWQES